ncbi:glycosyltransferase family 9 protein [Kineosporia sp. J2-2]|uniref:Glycosyltransferase family 9 protein n=1 Tax=Kineosporia corallincola TaxID=2835133 RepID=A0ABS5TEY3_9ACTN|nr:glycosyltransferase family 9 protein [Kineosporia corallincola]MBT0769636.1 glycosyltransferase family 9 protein [Kineosporia corallincola]
MTTGNVLILRALGLGDALTGVPALRGLRRRYPDARLTLLAPSTIGSWLRELGLVDAVVDARGPHRPVRVDGRPTVAVNLHGSGPESHRLLMSSEPDRLVAFATPEFPDGPAWDHGPEHEVDRWCRLVRADGGGCDRSDLFLNPRAVMHLGGSRGTLGIETWCLGEHVVIHPGAASGSRRWPARRWAAVARHLARAGARVVLTGSVDEKPLCHEIATLSGASSPAGTGPTDLAGRSTLPELAALIASARLLICGDTGVAHVATAVGTPSVLLFGPTSPRLWGPALRPGLHQVLWHGSDEAPGDPHGTRPDPALLAVQPPEVVAAALPRLAGTVTAPR